MTFYSGLVKIWVDLVQTLFKSDPGQARVGRSKLILQFPFSSYFPSFPGQSYFSSVVSIRNFTSILSFMIGKAVKLFDWTDCGI